MEYKRGIDVSYSQGEIDWETVKNSGLVDFAMIRAGYGQGSLDDFWLRNVQECTRLKIPFGVYWFSYAYSPERAKREAQYCLGAIAPYKLNYPVAFDFEYASADWIATKGVTLTKTLATDMARAFLDTIKAGGQRPMLYTNADYLSRYFDASLTEDYDVWLAQWPAGTPNLSRPPRECGIWQYANDGVVPGITANVVDLDAAYIDYPAILGGPYMSEYDKEKERARKWVMDKGISDGERGGDNLTREEMWVMLYRMNGGEKK